MAITYQNSSGLASKTTTTNGSLTLLTPSGSVANDLFVACIFFRGATTPSIPANWTIINRTQVTGNTNTNAASIGSGLMAYIKRDAGLPSFVFGATAGQQFPNLAIGTVIRLSGQDLTDPVAGTSVNTLASGGSGVVTTGGYTRSFVTDTPNDYIEIMFTMGGQEVNWSTEQYITGPISFSQVQGLATTAGADGSFYYAYSTTVGDTTGGFSAVTSAIAARHSIMVASFGGPRAVAAGYSFSTFF